MLQNKPFSFSVEGKSLEGCLSKVSQVLGVGTGDSSFILAVIRGKIKLIGLTADTLAVLTVPNSTTSSKEGAFSFDASDLQGLIKNRGVLDFKFNGSECEFKLTKGKYEGKVVTIPITEDQDATVTKLLSSDKKTQGVALPSEALSFLQAAVTASAVKDVYDGNPILSYVVFDKKGVLKVSAFDTLHFSFLRHETGIRGIEFRVALPGGYFSLIEKVAEGTEAKFVMASSSIRVEGKTFLLVMPSTQAEDKHYNMVENFMEAQAKSTFASEYEHSELRAVVDNLFTLFNVNSAFELSARDGGKSMSVALSTAKGRAADAVALDTKRSVKAFKAGVEPRLFRDIVGLASSIKDTRIEVNQKVVSIRGKVGDAELYLACAQADLGK